MTEKKKLDVLEKLAGVSGVVSHEPKAPKPKKSKDDLDVIFLKLDKAVVTQFRVLAAELGMSQKQLACEALNLLFLRHGKPAIA